MANEDSLDVYLNLVTSGANKALEGLKSSFSNTFKNINTDVSKADNSLGKVAGGLISIKTAALAAGTAIVAALASKQVIQKAIEDENALNSVAQALARTGEFSKQALADIEAYTNGLERNSVFSAGEIQQQFALAKAYGATTEQAKTITEASIELAAVTGKSLDEATRQVTSTLSGQAGALGKLSPRIKELTEDQLKAGAAARILLEQFGGSAIGQINTFGGALQQSRNVFENLLAQIGMLITKNPVIIEGIKGLTRIFGQLADFLERNREAIIRFVNEGILALLESAPKVGEFFKFLVDALTIVTKSLSLASAGVGIIINALLQFAPVKVLLDGLIATIGLVVGGLADLLSVLVQLPGVSDTLEAMGFNAETLSESLSKAATSSYDLINSFNVDVISEGVEKANEFAFAIVEGADAVRNNLNKQIDAGIVKAGELAKRVKSIGSGGQVELTVVNNTESVRTSIDNYQQLLETAFGGATGAKIGNSLIQGLSTGLKNGKEGARALLSSLAGTAADAFLPGLGAAVGPLVDVLSQGPEAVRQMVKDFAGAIPDLIEAIITAIPVLIEELAIQFPVIIDRLIDKLPDIINALIKAMPRVAIALALQAPKIAIALAAEAPKIAVEFIKGLVKGAPQFLKALISGIGDAIKNFLGLGGGIAGAAGDAVGGIGGSATNGSGVYGATVKAFRDAERAVAGFFENALGIKFARGGKVPKGFPNDSMPARLSSDEYVIDRGLTARLEKYLDGGSTTDVLLARMIRLLEQPMQVSSTVNVNNREFAQIILELNRTQQRTS